jgi:hypothetical protein
MFYKRNRGIKVPINYDSGLPAGQHLDLTTLSAAPDQGGNLSWWSGPRPDSLC